MDSAGPTIQKATYYEDESGVYKIEIAYSEDINFSAPHNYEVFVDGTSVANLSGSEVANGQVELTLSQAYSGDITVETPMVNDTAGNSLAGATVDVRETDATLNVGSGNLTAFKGSVVAVDFDNDGANNNFDITTGGGYFFQGSTGTTSNLYVFDTSGKTAGTYYVDNGRDNNDGAGDAEIVVRALDLSVSAPSEVQTSSTFTATVTANSGDRDVNVALKAPDGSTVDTATVTLDGSGEGSVSLTAGSATGNYTVVATDVATGNQDSTTVSVTSAPAASISFGSGSFSAEQGDFAYIVINMQGTTKTTVSIGGDETNYQINATVTDQNGDGQVVLMFNTYNAGTSRPTLDAAGADTVATEPGEVSLGDIIDTGAYVIFGEAGDVATSEVRDTPGATSTLLVESRSTGEMTLWEAPHGTTLNSLDTLEGAISDGKLTELSEGVAAGDVIVHQVSVSGIYGLLASKGAATTTAAFEQAVGDGNLGLTVTQTNPGQNQQPKVMDLGESIEAGAIEVIATDQANQIFIVVETDHAVFERDGQGETNFSAQPGDEFDVSFEVLPDSSDYLPADADGNDEATGNVSVVAGTAMVSYQGDAFQTEAEQNVTVSGSSTWAPGTTLTVRIKSDGGVTPAFFTQTDVVVQPDGTWSLDTNVFANASADSPFTITVFKGGAVVTQAPGEVVDSTTTTTTSTTTTTTTSTTTTTTSTTTTTTTSTTESTTTTESGDGGPGFTVALGLVAVLAAALLAVRRRQ